MAWRAVIVARRLLVSGRVQGVCYRDWTVGEARSRGLAGWVRNLADGRVEAIVEGDAGAVDAMVARCREGPSSARVTGLVAEDAAIERRVGFAKRADG